MATDVSFADIMIREVGPHDVAAITEIYAENVLNDTASWEYDPPDVEEMRRRLDAIVDGGYPYLVATSNGMVIGYSYASAYRTRIGYRYVVENSVYIHHAARGRGAGRMLMERLIHECTIRGYRQMVAVIGDSANVASIRMHEVLGFRHVGLLPAIGIKFDRWLDSVMMQRELGS